MIAHRISSFRELLLFSKEQIRLYCRNNNLPQIPVIPDDSSMDSEAKAAFDFVRVRILISPRLIEYIEPYNNTTRVWIVLNTIRHELKHYEQYLYRRKHKLEINRVSLNQTEAIKTGRLSASRAITNLSPEQINPILPEIGSGRNVTMTGTRAEIKLISPKPNNKKIYPQKGLYSSLFSKVTKKDRENAWERGAIK